MTLRSHRRKTVACINYPFLVKLLFTGRSSPGPPNCAGRRGRAAAFILMLLASGWVFTRAAGDPGKFPEFTADAAREYLGAVVAEVQAQPDVEAQAAFSLARVRSHLGEKQEAERLARRALERDPKRGDVAAFLAELLILQDRMEEAARLLQEALRVNPDIPGGYRRLGMALDRLGERDAAREALATAVRVAPKNAAARLLLGRLLLDQGEVKEAETHLQQACQLDPQQGGAFYLLSQAQTRLGDLQAAGESLRTFQQLKRLEKTSLDGKDASYNDEKFMRVLAAGFHTEVAGAFLRLKQGPMAEAHLRQAVLLAPEEAGGHEMLAALLLQAGRLNEARAACETLVRLQPREANYRVNFGTILLRLKEYPKAVEELTGALELNPDQPQALNNLARYYLGAGREVAEALRLAQRLVKLQPTAANFDLLGWAFYANGQVQEARSAAAEAVQREPANATYRERARKLNTAP